MQIRLRDFQNQEVSIEVSEFVNNCREHEFLHFFDAAAVKHDDEMQPLDWAVSTLLQAPIQQYEPLKQLAKEDKALWKDCNKALKNLGADLPLESDEAESKREAVKRCFEVFMKPSGIGPSIASKSLHKKRPQLLPVADDFVVRFFIPRDSNTLSAAQITDVIFDQFRPQLLKNLSTLEAARKLLEGVGPNLSNGRLLDIAIWSYVDKNRHRYGIAPKKSDKTRR